MNREDALRLAVEALRADAESHESGGPLADPTYAAECREAAKRLEIEADDGPPPRPYVHVVREFLRGGHDVVGTMIRLATLDPEALVFPGASVSNATDARVTLAGIAERAGIEADSVEIDSAYHVVAALGRVVASCIMPDAIYMQTTDTRLGADIVADLDGTTDTIRTWFGYLYG